jgi:transposase
MVYNGSMHIHRTQTKVGSKTYTALLLRESYREGKQVKKRTIANLTNWPPELVATVEACLKGRRLVDADSIQTGPGRAFGASFVFASLAKALRLSDALGSSRQGRLALMMAVLRPIKPVSKLGTVAMAQNQAVEELLGISRFDEDDLYGSLDWLEKNQDSIEDSLFQSRGGQCQTLFLYDVTSSYLEGQQNELAKYGYNRDKKAGKKQIVIGLLKDEHGLPVSVQVYEGNTLDHKTVSDQIKKLKERFGVKRVVMIGDRGMLKQAQIAELGSFEWNYITALTKPQVESLLEQGIIQLDLFDEKICEVEQEGRRLILRRNPKRAGEVAANRQSRLEKFLALVKEANEKLSRGLRADAQKSFQKISAAVVRYNLEKFVRLRLEKRSIEVAVDEEKVQSAIQLDGCYALVTDLDQKDCSAETVHERYKDLAQVESAFRLLKSSLDIRPMWHRRADRTRGHVFVAMLSLLLLEEFQRGIKNLDMTTEAAIDALNNIQLSDLTIGTTVVKTLPSTLRPDQSAILNALKLRLPSLVKIVA